MAISIIRNQTGLPKSERSLQRDVWGPRHLIFPQSRNKNQCYSAVNFEQFMSVFG